MARRFRIYIFGFILGLIVVYTSLLKDRTKQLFSWMPGPKVLKELQEFPLSITDKADCQLKCLQLGESFVSFILDNGDVDFSKSRPKETPRRYFVEVEKESQLYEVNLSCVDSTTIVESVVLVESPSNCNCN